MPSLFLRCAHRRAPRTRSACRRAGFSLVELLVVVGIIGLLLALLLPALQVARENGRRAQCLSNLRQLGIGLHSYHGTYQAFPPGCVEPKGRRLAWSVFLLPFIEQSALWRNYDLRSPYSSPANRQAGGVVLPIYLCPSTARLVPDRTGATSGDRNRNGRYDSGDDLAWTDYGGIFGAALPGTDDFMNGTLVWDRAIRLAQIRDGASQTLLVGEDTGRGWKLDSEWSNGENIFDIAGRVNVTQHNELWSDHPGGVNVLYCDGGARRLAESAEVSLLIALCTRHGGDIASEE
jgi:prepilin-type N-terminal cleavage/methylation domain-containing protein/prepilin-type processing-associated H-X9-DG protein